MNTVEFKVVYSDNGIEIHWPGWEITLRPDVARDLAHNLLRAVEDHTAHRKLIADVDGSFPDGPPQDRPPGL